MDIVGLLSMSIGYVCLDVKFSLFFSLLADKPTTTPRRGFIGKGKDITTKHDEVVCGRKNTARMENVSENFRKLILCVKLECCNSAKELMLVHQCCWVGCFYFFFPCWMKAMQSLLYWLFTLAVWILWGFCLVIVCYWAIQEFARNFFGKTTISKFGKQANKTQIYFEKHRCCVIFLLIRFVW